MVDGASLAGNGLMLAGLAFALSLRALWGGIIAWLIARDLTREHAAPLKSAIVAVLPHLLLMATVTWLVVTVCRRCSTTTTLRGLPMSDVGSPRDVQERQLRR